MLRVQPGLVLAFMALVGALATQVKKDDPVVMHRKARHGGSHHRSPHHAASHEHSPVAPAQSLAASEPLVGLSGMELLQQLAGGGGGQAVQASSSEENEAEVPPPAATAAESQETEEEVQPAAPVHPARPALRKHVGSKTHLQLLQSLHERTKRQRGGARHQLQQTQKKHQRLRKRSRLTAAKTALRRQKKSLSHSQRLAFGSKSVRENAVNVDAEEAAVDNATAQRQLTIVEAATVEVNYALHNNEQERDMLQTQMLSSGQSMFVLKRLAMTVQRMKSQIEVLEQHEKVCRKRVADFKSGQYQQAEDARLANSVQVVG